MAAAARAWALATPAVIALGRRYPLAARRPNGAWIVHAGACAAIGALFAAWHAALDIWLDPYREAPAWAEFIPSWHDKFASGALSSIILYAGILVVSYAFASRARLAFEQTETARLNERLTSAQLAALRRQIEPHFLFNALNAVAGLVREGRPDDALTTPPD